MSKCWLLYISRPVGPSLAVTTSWPERNRIFSMLSVMKVSSSITKMESFTTRTSYDLRCDFSKSPGICWSPLTQTLSPLGERAGWGGKPEVIEELPQMSFTISQRRCQRRLRNEPNADPNSFLRSAWERIPSDALRLEKKQSVLDAERPAVWVTTQSIVTRLQCGVPDETNAEWGMNRMRNGEWGIENGESKYRTFF